MAGRAARLEAAAAVVAMADMVVEVSVVVAGVEAEVLTVGLREEEAETAGSRVVAGVTAERVAHPVGTVRAEVMAV